MSRKSASGQGDFCPPWSSRTYPLTLQRLRERHHFGVFAANFKLRFRAPRPNLGNHFLRTMKTVKHELVVIGGGPAGYVAAIRAAQLGIDVACIDENDRFGGSCLRVGCIPSKALLESSHLYEEAQHKFDNHGIKLGKVDLDLGKMMERKNKIVDTLTGGIDMLFKKKNVTAYRGRGKMRDVNTVTVDGAEPLSLIHI